MTKRKNLGSKITKRKDVGAKMNGSSARLPAFAITYFTLFIINLMILTLNLIQILFDRKNTGHQF